MSASFDPNLPPELNRRNFLRLLVGGATAAVALSGCRPKRNSLHNLPTTTLKEVTTTEVPTTTTIPPTTTTAETLAPHNEILSATFLGAVEFQRFSDADPADARIVHRLNSGVWVPTKNGGRQVNPNPMLNYGFVYHQDSGQIGEAGQVAVFAAHDVTQINAPVTLNGITYNQPRVMNSVKAAPNLTDITKEVGNGAVGDIFTLYLNNPNDTVSSYTYTIRRRFWLNPVDTNPADTDPLRPMNVQSLLTPPTTSHEALLRLYNCWPPHTANLREVLEGVLTSKIISPGNVPVPANQPPQNATVIN